MDPSKTFRAILRIEKPTLCRILLLTECRDGVVIRLGPAVVTSISDDVKRRAVHVRAFWSDTGNRPINAFHISRKGHPDVPVRGIVYFWEWPPRVEPDYYPVE